MTFFQKVYFTPKTSQKLGNGQKHNFYYPVVSRVCFEVPAKYGQKTRFRGRFLTVLDRQEPMVKNQLENCPVLDPTLPPVLGQEPNSPFLTVLDWSRTVLDWSSDMYFIDIFYLTLFSLF